MFEKWGISYRVGFRSIHLPGNVFPDLKIYEYLNDSYLYDSKNLCATPYNMSSK
jgi:hypothetical protein